MRLGLEREATPANHASLWPERCFWMGVGMALLVACRALVIAVAGCLVGCSLTPEKFTATCCEPVDAGGIDGCRERTVIYEPDAPGPLSTVDEQDVCADYGWEPLHVGEPPAADLHEDER